MPESDTGRHPHECTVENGYGQRELWYVVSRLGHGIQDYCRMTKVRSSYTT